MSNELAEKKIAFLATDGVEEVELTQPWEAVENAGGTATLVSLNGDSIRAMEHMDKGPTFKVDKTVSEVSANDFHGLVIPGGLYNPDALRADEKAVQFVRDFFKQGKPVAAICHGPWLLVEADVLDGRTVTSYPSIQTDIKNAGGTWVDEECHCDQGLVTSRNPDDLPAFCVKAVEEFAEGKHAEQTA